MQSITVKNAESKLADIIAGTIHNNEEVVIVSDEGSVVMIEEKEWESIKETLKLLSDKQSLSALLEGHRIREIGLAPLGKKPEEIFTDV